MVTAISYTRLEIFCKIITSQSNHINSCTTILLLISDSTHTHCINYLITGESCERQELGQW